MLFFLATHLQVSGVQQDVDGLSDVSGVHVVVVGHRLVVVILQGRHERHKGLGVDVESPQKIALLKERVL